MQFRSLCLACACAVSTQAPAGERFAVVRFDPPVVPPDVAAAMRARGAEWTLPRYLMASVADDCTDGGYPYLVRGDFDGDGQDDHAFWASTRASTGTMHVLWVLESSRQRLIELDRDDGNEMHLLPLSVRGRGESVYDHHRGLGVTLQADAPEAVICWKSARAWQRQRDGSYREMLTSD
jgi:hypothetical protein